MWALHGATGAIRYSCNPTMRPVGPKLSNFDPAPAVAQDGAHTVPALLLRSTARLADKACLRRRMPLHGRTIKLRKTATTC